MFNRNAVQVEAIINQNDKSFIRSLVEKRYPLNVSSLLFLIEKYSKLGDVKTVEFLQGNEIWTPIVKLLLNDDQFSFTISERYSEDASAVRSYIIVTDSFDYQALNLQNTLDALEQDINEYNSVLEKFENEFGKNTAEFARKTQSIRNSRQEKVGQFSYFTKKLHTVKDRYEAFERDQNSNSYVNMYLFFIRVWNSMVHLHYDPETDRIVAPKYRSVTDLVVWFDLDVNADDYENYLHIKQTFNEMPPVYVQLPDGDDLMVDLTNGLVRPLNRRLLDITVLKNTEIAERSTSTWLKQATIATAGVTGSVVSILGLLYTIKELQDRFAELMFRDPIVDDNVARAFDQLQLYKEQLTDSIATRLDTGEELVEFENLRMVNNLKEAFKEAANQLDMVKSAKENVKRTMLTTMGKAGGFILSLFTSSLRPAYELGKDTLKRFRYDPNTLDAVEPNILKLYDRTYRPVLLIISSPVTEGVLGVFRLIRDEGEPPQLVPLNVYKHFDLADGRLNYQIKNE